MVHPLDDTIVAIASAPGGAARGIVRLSGPGVAACVQARFEPALGPPSPVEPTLKSKYPVELAVRSPSLLGREARGKGEANRTGAGGSLPAVAETGADKPLLARGVGEHAIVRTGCWRLPAPATLLPCEVYLWPCGRSYTGQAVAEIHTLGSPPLLEMLVQSVCRAGARLAEPGEFTLRAFLSGRIDLAQAEAVLGVIEAGNRADLDAALEQLTGGLSKPLHHLRGDLLDLLAHLEAGFDFPDEDLPFIAAGELKDRLAAAGRHVERLARQLSNRAESAERLRAVLMGMPNVGKSSLFNALSAGAALVSEQPGTTRDYLVAEIDLGSARCELIDTAGVVPATGGLSPLAPPGDIELRLADERGGIRRAAQDAAARQTGRAELQLLCLDATRPLDDWERRRLTDAAQDKRLRVVLTKADQPTATDYDGPAIRTSSRNGTGLDALRDALRDAATQRPTGAVASTAIRCGQSLGLAAEALARAAEAQVNNAGEELVAVDVRQALDEIGKVVGAVYTDDVLNVIFSRFCIGK